MDKNRKMPSGPAYRPGQPGAEDETPEGVARGAGGAKISPAEPRAAPAGTDAEAAAQKATPAENVVNLETRRPRIGTDPDRTAGGGYEGRDESRIRPSIAFIMIGAIVIVAVVLFLLMIRHT